MYTAKYSVETLIVFLLIDTHLTKGDTKCQNYYKDSKSSLNKAK